MKKDAGGLIELLFAFLIMTIIVAFAMKTALFEMKSTPAKNKGEVSIDKVDINVPEHFHSIPQVEEVVQVVENAKKLKYEEEQMYLNNSTR